MKPRLVKRGVWILARESIFLITLFYLYDNQYILTAVVHESDSNLTGPQTENSHLTICRLSPPPTTTTSPKQSPGRHWCNLYSTNIILLFFLTPKQLVSADCHPCAPDMRRHKNSEVSIIPHMPVENAQSCKNTQPPTSTY